MRLFLGDCSLAPSTLFADTLTDRAFEVRFLFDCVGHEVEIGFEANGFHRIVPSKDEQTLTISGRGLRLIDKNPDSTIRSTFELGCELKILNKKVRLSETSRSTMSDIQTEAQFLKDSLLNLRTSSTETAKTLKLVSITTLEELLWNRDLLIAAVRRAKLPSLTRIIEVLEASSEKTNFSELKNKYDEGLVKTLDAIKEHEKGLLERLSELKLRTLEILIDAEQEKDPDWMSLLNLFEQELTQKNTSDKQ